MALSRNRSGVYYNPLALHPLPPGAFPSLNQFWSQLAAVDSTVDEHWLWL
jgi:hypothetical protein